MRLSWEDEGPRGEESNYGCMTIEGQIGGEMNIE